MAAVETDPLSLPRQDSKNGLFKRQPSQTKSDPDRFVFGVLFRAKLIGYEDVKEDAGDELCQTSMIKLKAVVLAKKEHKRRICVKLNMEGIEITDEKTNEVLFKHSVNRISYIARDPADARAIGYIYKNSAKEFQYFAIKTERQAVELFNCLKELFEAVLEAKKAAQSENKEKSEENNAIKEEEKEEKAPASQEATKHNTPPATTSAQQPTASLFDVDDTPTPISSAVPALNNQAVSNQIPDLLQEPPKNDLDMFESLDLGTSKPAASTQSPKSQTNELMDIFNKANQNTQPSFNTNPMGNIFSIPATPGPNYQINTMNNMLGNPTSQFQPPSQPPRLPPMPPQMMQQQQQQPQLNPFGQAQTSFPNQFQQPINFNMNNPNSGPFGGMSPAGFSPNNQSNPFGAQGFQQLQQPQFRPAPVPAPAPAAQQTQSNSNQFPW